MEKIMLIKMVKSEQYNKIILTYVKIEENETDKFKGYPEYVEWIEDLGIFNKITKQDFGKVIEAETQYSKPDYLGKCKIELKNIISNGRKIEIR